MTAPANIATEAGKGQLVITRVYDAPRELVFKAWTEAERLAEWWGPQGFELGIKEFNLQPGGNFHYFMQGENGFKMWGKFIFQKISAPEQLQFINTFSDEEGNLTRAPFSETWPQEMMNSLTLSEKNGKTTMTLTGWPVNATEEEQRTYTDGIPSMHIGFKGTFDKLEQYLQKAQA